MREIKFRAWDKDAKKWYESEYLMLVINTIGHVFEVGDEGAGWEQNKRFEIQQFTGLKDKNGKEIYEGDCIQSSENDEVYRIDEIVPVHRHSHLTNIGYFGAGKFCSRKPEAAYDNLDDFMSNPEFYEVIGNIYEDPELLDQAA